MTNEDKFDSLSDFLKFAIAHKVHIPFKEEKRTLILTEEKNEGKNQLESVELRFRKNTLFHFAFKLDDPDCCFLGKLFNTQVKHLRKAVDAVIFIEYQKNKKNKKYIFFVEMKSEQKGELSEKYKSSTLFWKFLNSFLEAYHEKLNWSDAEIVYILFDRNIRKEIKGKAPELPIKDIKYRAKGFSKPTYKDNKAEVEEFIAE